MPLYRYCFVSIGIDGVITALPEQVKTILLKVLNYITPLIKHPERGPGLIGQAFD